MEQLGILFALIVSFCVNAPIFFWMRKEINVMQCKNDCIAHLVRAMHDEMRDFHECLKEIEKKRDKHN